MARECYFLYFRGPSENKPKCQGNLPGTLAMHHRFIFDDVVASSHSPLLPSIWEPISQFAISSAERRQDGDGRGVAHGGHGALLGGAAGRHAAALDGRRRPGVLLALQRVPAQRLGQIVSTTAYKSRLENCLLEVA